MTGPDYLRIGDAERDAMAESLHEHFVQGRLDREELDERLAATLTAKTVGELREVDRDLPRPPATAARPGGYAPEAAEGLGGPPWAAHRRLARHHGMPPAHRHGPHPLKLILAAAVIIGIGVAVSGGAAFAVLRVFFAIWLVMAVVGMLHGRRWHRAHRMHRMHRPPPR